MSRYPFKQFELPWIFHKEFGGPASWLIDYLPMPQLALHQVQHVGHGVVIAWLKLKLIYAKNSRTFLLESDNYFFAQNHLFAFDWSNVAQMPVLLSKTV